MYRTARTNDTMIRVPLSSSSVPHPSEPAIPLDPCPVATPTPFPNGSTHPVRTPSYCNHLPSPANARLSSRYLSTQLPPLDHPIQLFFASLANIQLRFFKSLYKIAGFQRTVFSVKNSGIANLLAATRRITIRYDAKQIRRYNDIR